MHRDGVEAWEPISDECVHMFHSNGDQPSGGLDTTVGNGLHFKTDQFRTLAAVCEKNAQNHDVILEDFLQGKKCSLSLPIIRKNYPNKVFSNIWNGCPENRHSMFVFP